MPLTIAVTGATGFAGHHAVAELMARGHRVAALDRDPGRGRLPAGVRVVRGDIGNPAALGDLVAGADTVIHLAGSIAGLSRADYFAVNRDGTAVVARAAVEAGIRRFVHVSSLSAREPDLCHYGASKSAGERAVREAFGAEGLTIVRPPAIYGPGDRATLPLFRSLTGGLALVPGNRSSRFSLMHVSDVARSLAEIADNGPSGLVELSDGMPGGYCWEDLARIAAGVVDRPVRLVFLPRGVVSAVALAAEGMAQVMRRPMMVNRGKVAELYHPDWVASGPGLPLTRTIGFAEGFAGTLAWYREAGWLPRGRRADRTSPTTRNETGP
jgi:nucleoside-diphosphate-sugar epimerase